MSDEAVTIEPKALRSVVSVDFEPEHFEQLETMAVEQKCTVADIIRDEVTTMLAFLSWVQENEDWAAAYMEPDLVPDEPPAT